MKISKVFLRNLTVVVSLLVVLALVLGACAPKAAAPTAAAKPARVYIDAEGDVTGPYAATAAAFLPGFEDGLKYVNSRGGVNGVPVDYRVRDSGLKLDVALANYAEMRAFNPKPIIICGWVTPESESLKPRVDEDKIVLHTIGLSDQSLYPPGYVVGMQPEYADNVAMLYDWLADVWAKKTGQPVKLGIVTWDSAYGRIPIDKKECLDYAAQKGIEIVAKEVFKLTDMDMSTQVKRAYDAGANWIFDFTGAVTPLVGKSIAGLGILNQDIWNVVPGKVWHASGNWGTCEAATRRGAEYQVGLVSPRWWPSFDEPNIARQHFDSNGREPEEGGLGYILGFAVAVADSDMYKRVVDKYGWEGLTGENVLNEFISLKEYNVSGLTYWTLTPDKRAPRKGRMTVMVPGGIGGAKVEYLTDWQDAPDNRPYAYRSK